MHRVVVRYAASRRHTQRSAGTVDCSTRGSGQTDRATDTDAVCGTQDMLWEDVAAAMKATGRVRFRDAGA